MECGVPAQSIHFISFTKVHRRFLGNLFTHVCFSAEKSLAMGVLYGEEESAGLRHSSLEKSPSNSDISSWKWSFSPKDHILQHNRHQDTWFTNETPCLAWTCPLKIAGHCVPCPQEVSPGGPLSGTRRSLLACERGLCDC